MQDESTFPEEGHIIVEQRFIDVETVPIEQDREETGSQEEYIKDLSHRVSDPLELSVDEQLLKNVVREAGDFSYGIASVEVYSFEDPRLVPETWWRNPTLNLAVAAPHVHIPGVDMVGTLWALQHSCGGNMKKSSSFSSLVRRASFVFEDNNAPPSPPPPTKSRGLRWRDLESLIDDPDASHGPRLESLQKAGLTKATGISFDCHGHRGIVVYYAMPNVDMDRLSAVANEAFLRRSASLIGSVLAMTEARRASIAFQREFSKTVKDDESTSKASLKESSKVPTTDSLCTSRNQRLQNYSKKLYGGGAQIPPPMPWHESCYTILGAFVGLLILSALNKAFFNLTDAEYYLLMGPFGALMTLQYGLTAAPASQPRNVVLGQVVAGAVSMAFTYIPSSVIPIWIRQALGPAFSIAAMVKLGIPHPPAGAHSVIYAEGKHNWTFYGIVVLGSVVSIIPAILVNNLSRKRQYPTYWGYAQAHVSQEWKDRKERKMEKE